MTEAVGASVSASGFSGPQTLYDNPRLKGHITVKEWVFPINHIPHITTGLPVVSISRDDREALRPLLGSNVAFRKSTTTREIVVMYVGVDSRVMQISLTQGRLDSEEILGESLPNASTAVKQNLDRAIEIYGCTKV